MLYHDSTCDTVSSEAKGCGLASVSLLVVASGSLSWKDLHRDLMAALYPNTTIRPLRSHHPSPVQSQLLLPYNDVKCISPLETEFINFYSDLQNMVSLLHLLFPYIQTEDL